MDLVRLTRQPEDAPLIDKVSIQLLIVWRRGYNAHRGSFESEIGRPR
jgi:hypothetical protein